MQPFIRPWTVIDTSEWPYALTEVRGRRLKEWRRGPDGRAWLRKSPFAAASVGSLPARQRPYEPVIETSLLRLATAAQLPAPDSDACVWDDEGQRRGIVVRSFIDKAAGENLTLGQVILEAQGPGYDPERHGLHTLDAVRKALIAAGLTLLLPNLLDILLFDAWVGNADRHQENWGVVESPSGQVHLAPIFDLGSCLGTELDDSSKLLTSPSDVRLCRYIAKCPSGFGIGDSKKLIFQPQVIEAIREWPECEDRWKSLLPRFESALPVMRTYLESVDPDWLPPARLMLAVRLLELRLEWLKMAMC